MLGASPRYSTMKLQCPIKEGIKVRKWYARNTKLTSLEDFKLCISQEYGQNLRDYASIGIPFHSGIDIVFEEWTEIYASHDGEAHFTEDSMKGLGVTITDKEKKTIYWHMRESVRPLGSKWQVKTGDLIGYGDSTGYSTGHHLHYGLKLLDASGNVLNRDNGVDGAVDPLPYITWWDNMNDVEVRKLYRLAFYRDPTAEELSFWSGRSLSEFLTVALKDRAQFLSSPI
jgi:hypothetical protein